MSLGGCTSWNSQSLESLRVLDLRKQQEILAESFY